MKIKTTELEGPALDWAVAEASGVPIYRSGKTLTRMDMDGNHYWQPSTDWSQAGPIIELERIATWFERYDEDTGLPCWSAVRYCGPEYQGPTPLIAAMRCYVASVLGEEVMVPVGLNVTQTETK